MQKSLLLLNFLPVRAKTKSSSDSSEVQDIVSDKCQRIGSVVETDFQAAPSLSSSRVTHPISTERGQITQSDTKTKQVPAPFQTEEASAFHSKPAENATSQQDVSSPPSTPTRKSQFSRGRLRLLSFRSIEEPRPVPTVKEKYPILKNILDFIKDQSLSHER